MKIAIGMQPYGGPWGGGNRFVMSLSQGLAAAGWSVVYTLDDTDIDAILLMDPRPRSPNVTFTDGAILRYLALRNPNAIVIHRVNECDERKGEVFINRKLVRANYVADVTVFVGRWMADLPVWRANLREPWFVIHNGSDTTVFNASSHQHWDGQEPVKVVTHHWGYHRNKGFDVYETLDRALGVAPFNRQVAFTYIGNLPRGFAFKNSRYVPPLDGLELATALSQHHIYLTGSLNEPGGNHQNEGALCGLPLVFRQSGCMPEYCDGFGIGFSGPEDVMPALQRMIHNLPAYKARMQGYPHTAVRMTQDWVSLLNRIADERDQLLARRRLWRSPLIALSTQLVLR